MMKFEGDTNRNGNLDLTGHAGSIWHWNLASVHGHVAPVVIQPENNALGGVTTNRIYIAGIAGGAFDFSTGVTVDGAITSDSATDITVADVDPRKAFRVGDTVYLHDVDTALGTIASMDSTSIILNEAIAGGTNLADDDELQNAQPITITLGFKGR